MRCFDAGAASATQPPNANNIIKSPLTSATPLTKFCFGPTFWTLGSHGLYMPDGSVHAGTSAEASGDPLTPNPSRARLHPSIDVTDGPDTPDDVGAESATRPGADPDAGGHDASAGADGECATVRDPEGDGGDAEDGAGDPEGDGGDVGDAEGDAESDAGDAEGDGGDAGEDTASLQVPDADAVVAEAPLHTQGARAAERDADVDAGGEQRGPEGRSGAGWVTDDEDDGEGGDAEDGEGAMPTCGLSSEGGITIYILVISTRRGRASRVPSWKYWRASTFSRLYVDALPIRLRMRELHCAHITGEQSLPKLGM